MDTGISVASVHTKSEHRELLLQRIPIGEVMVRDLGFGTVGKECSEVVSQEKRR